MYIGFFVLFCLKSILVVELVIYCLPGWGWVGCFCSFFLEFVGLYFFLEWWGRGGGGECVGFLVVGLFVCCY